jgi:Domain of unknown function (DUF4276)
VSAPWRPITIASVVEGDGEVRALPKLLQRIAADLGIVSLRTPQPHRRPRGSLIRDGGIETAVDAAAVRVIGLGGVLVLLDADDDCPADLAPRLLQRARAARQDKRIAVVLANREFEAWFLAAAPSLAGQHEFGTGLTRPTNPEAARDCKGLLSEARPKGHPYKETVDQAPLASAFDMKMARQYSGSFDKFYREVSRLLSVS